MISASLLISVLLVVVGLIPLCLRKALTICGHRLRRRNYDKYNFLLNQADKDDLSTFVSAQTPKSPHTVDDDWERVESTNPSARNGESIETQWRGVVGFFHPFW